MTAAPEWIVVGLLRASFGLAVAALSVAACVRLLRPRAAGRAVGLAVRPGARRHPLPHIHPGPLGFLGTRDGPAAGTDRRESAGTAPGVGGCRPRADRARCR